MISNREKGLHQLLALFQIFAAIALFWLTTVVILQAIKGENEIPFFSAYIKYAIVIIGALAFESISRPENMNPVLGRAKYQAGATTRRQIMFVVISITALLVFTRDQRLSRIFFATYSLTLFAFLYLSNRYSLNLINRAGLKYFSHWRLRAMILGPETWCNVVLPNVQTLSSNLDVQRVVFTDCPESEQKNFSEIIAQSPIDLLILTMDGLPNSTVIEMLRLGDRLGFRCWLPFDMSHAYGRHFNLQRFGSIDVLTPPAEPLQNTLNQVIKRGVDVAFSIPVAIFILPILCVLVKIIHAKYSPGPLFFRQDRVGKNGNLFEVIKFRTLHTINEAEERQVRKDDDRVFKFGRTLRRFSIDEMPQFLNVLKGDMSVVGPRPHMEAHDLKFKDIFERYGVRRYVKPGLTGLAQVKGYRGEITKPIELRHRARLDSFYVTKWNIALDFRIIALTLLTVVVPPKTAY